MQLLYDGSEESPGVDGLGILARCRAPASRGCEAPADAVEPDRPAPMVRPLFAGLGERPWMYFVHSFAAELDRRRRGHL